MVGFSSVSASVHSWLLLFLNFLILQSFLDLEQLLRSRFDSDMADCTDRGVPCGFLGAEEVAVNLMLHLIDSRLSFQMIRISVLFPAIEARLVLCIVQLTVMD